MSDYFINWIGDEESNGLAVPFISIPPAPPAGIEAITARSGGLVRSDFTGLVGFTFTVTTATTVTDLGRIRRTGNANTHNITIYDGSSVIASATVDVSSGTIDTFQFTSITPIGLSTGHTYWIMSAETNSGDTWYDRDQSVTLASGLTLGQSAYNDGTYNQIAGNAYGPPSFKFTQP